MRTFSYKNLHRNCFSVRNESTGRVAYRENYVCVQDTHLVVGQKGRQKVLDTKQKNVHAGVRGELFAVGFEALCAFHAREGWTAISYNPYKTSTFVVKDTGAPVTQARMVFLGPRGAFALLE